MESQKSPEFSYKIQNFRLTFYRVLRYNINCASMLAYCIHACA